jgi:hypothetical protein
VRKQHLQTRQCKFSSAPPVSPFTRPRLRMRDLPEGYSRSYAGFLIHNHHREISVDQDVVKQEMDYLTQFVLIVCFIGGSPPMAAIPQWIKQLQNKIKSSLSFRRPLGKGFFTVKATEQDAVQRLMLLSPFRSFAGLCIFQWWVPDFDPNADRGIHKGNCRADIGLKIPTWITLRNLQDEFRGVAHQIAAGLGEVLGASSDNSESKDPKFCVGLLSGEGWEHSVQVTNSHTQTTSTVMVDYEHLPIHCHYCGDIAHCLRDCPSRPGPRRP